MDNDNRYQCYVKGSVMGAGFCMYTITREDVANLITKNDFKYILVFVLWQHGFINKTNLHE